MWTRESYMYNKFINFIISLNDFTLWIMKNNLKVIQVRELEMSSLWHWFHIVSHEKKDWEDPRSTV